MKKIVILLICTLISIEIYTQEYKGVVFEKGKFSQAFAKAKKEFKGNKLVFTYWYTDGCPFCIEMTKSVFPSENSGTFINSNFVSLSIDAGKEEGVELAKKYQVKSFPTYIVFSSDGKEINRFSFSMDESTFIEFVKNLWTLLSKIIITLTC